MGNNNQHHRNTVIRSNGLNYGKAKCSRFLNAGLTITCI